MSSKKPHKKKSMKKKYKDFHEDIDGGGPFIDKMRGTLQKTKERGRELIQTGKEKATGTLQKGKEAFQRGSKKLSERFRSPRKIPDGSNEITPVTTSTTTSTTPEITQPTNEGSSSEAPSLTDLTSPRPSSNSGDNQGEAEAGEAVSDGFKTDMGDPISTFFNILFLIITVCAVIAVVILFIITIINLFSYKKFKKEHDIKQKYNLVIIKDTLDYQLLSYLEKSKTEPLLLKAIFTTTNIIFILVAAYVLTFCVLGAIYIGLTMVDHFRPGSVVPMKLILDRRYPLILAICFVGTIIVYDANKKLYVDKTLPALLDTKKTMYELKETIKKYLYIDPTFLNFVRENNDAKVEQMIIDQLTNGGDTKTNNDIVSKMIFTYDVRRYYTELFPQSDFNNQNIIDMFDPEKLKNGTDTFEPAEYLKYTDSDFKLLTFYDYFMYDILPNNETLIKAFKSDTQRSEIASLVNSYIDSVNRYSLTLTKLRLEENTNSLVEYIYAVIYRSVVAVLLVVGVLLINPQIRTAIKEVLTLLGKGIKSFIKGF